MCIGGLVITRGPSVRYMRSYNTPSRAFQNMRLKSVTFSECMHHPIFFICPRRRILCVDAIAERVIAAAQRSTSGGVVSKLPCKSTCCRRAAAYHTGAAVYGDFFAPKQHARRRGTLKGRSRSLAARSTTLRLTRRHARRRHTLDGDTLDGCMLDGALRRCARRRHDRRRHLCTEEPGTSSPQQLLRAKSPHARRRCAQRRHTLDGGTLDGCMLDGALLGALRRLCGGALDGGTVARRLLCSGTS